MVEVGIYLCLSFPRETHVLSASQICQFYYCIQNHLNATIMKLNPYMQEGDLLFSEKKFLVLQCLLLLSNYNILLVDDKVNILLVLECGFNAVSGYDRSILDHVFLWL